MASTINRNETYAILGSTLQDICDSVSEKTGADDIPVAQLPKKIAGIGGLAYEDIKDVMFMDYNGDLLYSWDKDDFIYNVDALPAGPTLYHTNCFTGINASAKIKVPASLETSWKAATNWSTYASYIVGV